MIINFNKLILHNFMSFEDAEITLNNTGYCLISGINDNVDDLASSNGSGKSSIWEGLLWALTGQTIRGCKNIVRLGDNDGCYVQVNFTLDDKDYKILRSKDHKQYKTNLKIYINDKDMSGKGIRDTEKLLEEYIPELTTQLIGSVIILGQGLPQRFTNNSPSGRKEVLEKLSKSDFMIQDLKDRISNRKIKLATELRVQEDNSLKAQSEINIYNNQLIQLQQKLDKINSVDIEKVKTDIEIFKKNIEDLNTEQRSNNEQLKKLNDLYIENQNKIQAEASSLVKLLDEIDSEYSVQITEAQNNVNNATIDYNSLKREVAQLDSISDVCPTCGQKLIGVTKPDTTEKHNKINKLRDEIVDFTATLNLIKQERDAKKSNLRKQNQENTKEQQEINSQLQSSIRQLNACITSVNSEINQENIKINNSQIVINSYDSQKTDTEKQIEELENKINENKLYITNIQDTIDNIKSHVEVINKFDTLIKRDFRGYLLSNVINFISARAKQYCKDIFNTEKIKFELDGNNISISYLDKEYESLSGGEKQKIDLIVQFSIRDMLCTFLNFSSNILVLDEVTDSLDNIGCQNIINFISSKLHDVSNIYLISHRKDLDIPYDRELIVKKNIDGISKIVENVIY